MPVKSTRPLLLSYSPTDGCMGLPGPHARCGLRGRPVLWRPYRLATRQLVTEVIIVRRQHGRPAVACVIVPLTAVGDVVGIDQSIHVTCHRLITTARGARFNDRGRLIAIMLMYIPLYTHNATLTRSRCNLLQSGWSVWWIYKSLVGNLRSFAHFFINFIHHRHWYTNEIRIWLLVWYYIAVFESTGNTIRCHN